MNEAPSMWRTELWHPLSVHFPIALLTLAAVTGIAYLIFRQKSFAPHLNFSLTFLTVMGVLTYWVAYRTGLEAYSIQIRKICDPSVLKDHLYWAWVTGWVFSAAALLKIATRFFTENMHKLLNFIIVIILIAGNVGLHYSGHLGARLVYQQGAGVYHPSEDCYEFE